MPRVARYAAMAGRSIKGWAPLLRAGAGPIGSRARRPFGDAVAVQAVQPERWDSIVAQFADIHQEQTFAFAAARWPLMDIEPLLFSAGGRPFAGALVTLPRLPLGLGRIAMIRGGIMFHASAPQSRLCGSVVDALVERYVRQRRTMLTVRLAAQPAQDRQFGELVESGFVAGAGLPFPDRYFVDLRTDEAAFRADLHQKWRYHLARAENAGLHFERAGPDGLGRFARLYREMSDRKRFADHSPYETLPAMMQASEPALRPQLFFVRAGGQTVAGAVIFAAGRRASYLYGATSDRALPLRAGYFMQWHIIRWLKQHSRARWYDLGGTDGFEGLHRFKAGLVGRGGRIAPAPPRLSIASGRIPLLLGYGAFAARDTLNNVREMVCVRQGRRAEPDLPPRRVA